MQRKLKSKMKQCNAVVRENRQHYRNQLNICREPQQSKWNDSTEQWNWEQQQHKKGLISEELEIQVPFADFQIVQRKQGRVTYTLTTCRDYLQGNSKTLLLEVKTNQLWFNCATAPLHLCKRAGYVWNMHRRNGRTQTHLQLQTNPMTCICLRIVLHESIVFLH